MEYRSGMDGIEVFDNNHGTNTLPLNFVTTSNTQQYTESDSIPQRAATETATAAAAAAATGTPQEETSNPIAQIFLDQDLGKLVIGVVMPMTVALLNPHVPVSSLMKKVILLSISLGFFALWHGHLLRQTLPRHAMAIEQLGATLVLLSFYAVVSSFLPASLVWLPSICFALALFPFFLGSYLRRPTDR